MQAVTLVFTPEKSSAKIVIDGATFDIPRMDVRGGVPGILLHLKKMRPRVGPALTDVELEVSARMLNEMPGIAAWAYKE